MHPLATRNEAELPLAVSNEDELPLTTRNADKLPTELVVDLPSNLPIVQNVNLESETSENVNLEIEIPDSSRNAHPVRNFSLNLDWSWLYFLSQLGHGLKDDTILMIHRYGEKTQLLRRGGSERESSESLKEERRSHKHKKNKKVDRKMKKEYENENELSETSNLTEEHDQPICDSLYDSSNLKPTSVVNDLAPRTHRELCGSVVSLKHIESQFAFPPFQIQQQHPEFHDQEWLFDRRLPTEMSDARNHDLHRGSSSLYSCAHYYSKSCSVNICTNWLLLGLKVFLDDNFHTFVDVA
ncbi:hypothetical protein LWI28_021983 [Acer negundo]|uniref:Uncharacterized protein n=1 Tax=Acer negundo TaxID=4023 RepID=A0AAD5JXI8_ACENE|nr:hypothetical protein LWI28_021983 [Acer negundo]